MQVVSVNDYTFDKSTSLSLLVGSGISLWEPSNLPTGQQFAGALLAALFWDEMDREILNLASKVPFENIMDLCPTDGKLEELVRQLYDVYRPNGVHATLARALADGYIKSIVTTNYDGCLDKALSDQFECPIGRQFGSVRRVVNRDDIEREGTPTGCCYFKIHGSTDDRTPGSLVFRLRDEGALPHWKRELLLSLWRGRALVIVGYSGFDFEISPEIPLIRPAHVTWNVLKTCGMSPNARRVMDTVKGTVVEGDMRSLLDKMFSRPGKQSAPPSGQRVPQTLNSTKPNLNELFVATFAEHERILWRARLLNHLGASTLAGAACERLLTRKDIDKVELLTQLAQAAFHGGRHGDSARTFERAARLTDATDEKSCSLLLAASDAWRARGSFVRAWRMWSQARTKIG